MFAANVEGEGNVDLSNLAGCPDLRHRASNSVVFQQLQELCSTASLFLLPSVVDLILLAVTKVHALSSCLIIHTRLTWLRLHQSLAISASARWRCE